MQVVVLEVRRKVVEYLCSWLCSMMARGCRDAVHDDDNLKARVFNVVALFNF